MSDLSNKLNITLPVDVAVQLDSLALQMKTSKKDLALQALRQYIAIKSRELFLREENPDVRIESEVTLKAYKGRRPRDIASVMIY